MRKRREDSFFGIHLDYHAKPEDGLVQGLYLEENHIRDICRLLKPDFIQIDCKGHRGYASYPTALSNAMPEFSKDTLSLWRRVTMEEGVALYMHYSGVYDMKYCKDHPEQEVIRSDGSGIYGATRLNGRYSDEVLIPQLTELAEKYRVDGVWIDGDCWMACADFSKESLAEFERETGIALNGVIPDTADKPYYNEYRDYHRELFRRYLRKYVDTLHERCPGFQIASNWAFSDHMPEKVCASVDFLSGDLNPANSFNSARYAARALAQQGMSWDLMSWNFRNALGTHKAYVQKHPVQIMQEAASVISMGGAFQDYVPQLRDGSPNMPELKTLVGVSEFIRKRRDFCFKGEPVPQAALLLSTHDRYLESAELFSRTGFERAMGATALLCDIGQSLEILCEHNLYEKADQYEMIVVPELYSGLENKTVACLCAYARNGGKLVLMGKNTCKLFAEASDLPYSVEEMRDFVSDNTAATLDGHNATIGSERKPYLFTLDEKESGALISPCEIVSDGRPVAYAYEKGKQDRAVISATVPYGLGSVTAIGFDIGKQYLIGEQYMHRRLMKNIADSLYTPKARIESSVGRVEIVALSKDGKLMIQLVNGNGSHSNSACASDDLIPPALDIEVSVALERAPASVVLQPEGRELGFTYENGRAYISVDRLNIHSVLEISV